MAIERYAMIVNGMVENICMWDGQIRDENNPGAWEPPANCTMVLIGDAYCGPGFTWDGSEFYPPADKPTEDAST